MKYLRILPTSIPEASIPQPRPSGPPIVLHLGTGAMIAKVLACVPQGGLSTQELLARAKVERTTAAALDAGANAIPYQDEDAATLQRVVQAMRWADYHPGYAAFAEAVMDMPADPPTPPPPPLADAG